MTTESGDKALALLAAKGDGDAFRQLLERHYDTVFRIAFRFSGHREEAEDIAQDVCVTAGQAEDLQGEFGVFHLALPGCRQPGQRRKAQAGNL